MEERTERMNKVVCREEWCEILSSGYGMNIVPMSSQWLRLLAQYRKKLGLLAFKHGLEVQLFLRMVNGCW